MDKYVDAKYIDNLAFHIFDAMISIAKSGEDAPHKIRLLESMRSTVFLLWKYKSKLQRLEKERAMASRCRPNA